MTSIGPTVNSPTPAPWMSRRRWLLTGAVCLCAAEAVRTLPGIRETLHTVSLNQTLAKLHPRHKSDLLSSDNTKFTRSVNLLIDKLADKNDFFKKGSEELCRLKVKYQAYDDANSTLNYRTDRETNSIQINLAKIRKGSEADQLRKLVATIAASMASSILDKPALRDTLPPQEALKCNIATQVVVSMVFYRINNQHFANQRLDEVHKLLPLEIETDLPLYCREACMEYLGKEPDPEFLENVHKIALHYLHGLKMDDRTLLEM